MKRRDTAPRIATHARTSRLPSAPWRLRFLRTRRLRIVGASRSDTPQRPSSSFAVPGLEKPAEVLVDRWGVPHLYAGTLYDAFVAQGFIAARDRLWQMDLWRKRGLGEMAKDFGPAWVESDRAARAVLYRGDMYREWLAYGSDAKRVAEAFTAGVNAYVAQVRAQPALLPTEFALLGYQPATWSPEDVVRIRHHGLTLNFTSEVDRARAFCAGGAGHQGRLAAPRARSAGHAQACRRGSTPAPFRRRSCAPPTCGRPSRRSSPRTNTRVGLNTGAASTPVALLPGSAESAAAKAEQDEAATASPARRSHGRLRQQQLGHFAEAHLHGPAHPGQRSAPLARRAEPALHDAPERARHGRHRRGRALPAGPVDRPQRHHRLRPHALLHGPGRPVRVPAQPAQPQRVPLPGPLGADDARHRAHRGRGESAPREVVNTFTRHGPVLLSEPGKRRAYALRAAWLEPGMAPYFGSMDYMRARNWDQFRAAMNRWGAPGENQVYADSSGNVGWIPGGLTPIRPNWDGLMPVPGDGRYEWSGFRNGDELPSEFNPARGYVVTANENNIPPDHPAAKKGIGYEWSDAARARRLKELFAAKVAAGSRFTIEDSERMQNDIVATPAQRL
jgi:penicillin amidase